MTAALLFAASNNVPFGYYVDDIQWVLLAERLLLGRPDIPWSPVPAFQTNLNWGFSFLLLPAVAAAGRGVLFLKLFATSLFLAGLWAFDRALAGRSAGERAAFVSLVGLNAYTLSYAGNLLSELGYVFLFGTAMLLLTRREGTVFSMLALGGVAGVLVLTRTIGVAFVLAAAVGLAAAGEARRLPLFGLTLFLVCALLPGLQAGVGRNHLLRVLLGPGRRRPRRVGLAVSPRRQPSVFRRRFIIMGRGFDPRNRRVLCPMKRF